jgi:signal transduction histidine kinase
MPRRRRWLFWGSLVYVAILIAVTVSLFLLNRASRRELDHALGERLVAVAVTASYLVDGDSLVVWAIDPQETLDFVWLASRLEQLRLQNELAEITLCDADERVLISATGRLSRGEKNLFWDLDREAVQVALGGFPSTTRLYRVGELYQKSAHAPILASDGQVTGVLTVEGNADFFEALTALQRGAVLTGIAVLVFLSLMGWLLFRLQSAMERYRASVLQQENLAAMGRMTAGIAHEIRNPLGIISGTAQHLERRLQAAGVEDETVGYIQEEVARLDRILTGYLAFGSDAAVQKESLELARTVTRTVKLVAEEFAAAGVTIEPPVIDGHCRVKGDPHRLQQVLLNLLLNARDAMPEGGRIEIALQPDGSQAVLTVTDEGAGLQGWTEEKLFSPFWTSKEKGSGLGLSVARRVVENLDGSLQLRDRRERAGAVAELRLPLEEDDPATTP